MPKTIKQKTKKTAITKTPYYSCCIGDLAKGCRLCVKGQKTVIFITGHCASNCYFCPISDKKKNKDVVYINEWPTSGLKDCFKEIRLCSSKGVGITGGDPLARTERTCSYIKRLKQKFGKSFHIHLYTPLILVDEKKLDMLHKAGLDEIRFHPDLDSRLFWHRLKLAKKPKYKWDIGVEMPVIPNKEKQIINLINFIKDDIGFLNLNELEISDTNANKLVELGYTAKDSFSYAVKNSDALAKKILKYCESKIKSGEFNFSVHYCTTTLKDKIQLAERIKRRAKSIKKDYDVMDKEGLLTRGAIYLLDLAPGFGYAGMIEEINRYPRKKEKVILRLDKIKDSIKNRFDIPSKLIDVDHDKLRILIAPWILGQIYDKINLKVKSAIVKEYPTWDKLIIELEFL